MESILFCYDFPIDPLDGGIARVTYTLSNFLEANYCYRNFYLSIKKKDIICLPNQFVLPNKNIYTEENFSFFSDIIKENNITVVVNQSAHFAFKNGMSQFLIEYKKRYKSIKLLLVFHY